MPDSGLSARLFRAVTAFPRIGVFVGLVVAALPLAFVPRLVKDTSSEAFLPPGHPSVEVRERVAEIFGLRDPVVVAVVDDGPEGVFTSEGLALIARLTEEIRRLPGVDPERVTSLATENDVVGTETGLVVEPFFETPPATAAGARRVREAILDFPLYLGSLVARDGRATLIVAELLDAKAGSDVYLAIRAIADRVAPGGPAVHVAGEGAVRDYLGRYIDQDAKRLNGFAVLIITAILFLTYRTLRGVLLPNLVVLGAIGAALGSMAASGTAFFVITNALPVILIAIAVADAIHILGQYYEEAGRDPGASGRELTVRAMVAMWRPVTVTSLTDVAGFLALSFTSEMPPMQAFGIFASLGVIQAWLLSVTVVPCALAWLAPRRSRVFAADGGADGFGRLMDGLGRCVSAHPQAVVLAGGLVLAAGAIGFSGLEVNEERIRNFRESEPIAIADRTINARLDGTSFLDVMVEAPEAEGLFDPARLRRIESLQRFLDSQPHVGGTTSIVDFLKQMNRSLHADRTDAYVLPDDPEVVAQLFLLYTASGSPTDFEEYVDYDYRLANVRARLDTGVYREIVPVVEATERWLAEHLDGPELRGTLTGRVNVDYHWIEPLAADHFRSVGWAFVAVWAMASISFGSLAAGTFATLPVFVAVLLVYAVMGGAGIWLGIGTSMFAAIAIGTSIDFSVHALDRILVLVREHGRTLEDAVCEIFPTTGRALLFSFLALFFGFGVLMTSQVPPLARFGLLVSVCALASFVGSLTLLPAALLVMKPGFARPAPARREANAARRAAAVTFLLLAAGVAPASAGEEPAPDGLEIARRVNARDEGEAVTRTLVMELTDRRGKTRTRVTRGFRKYYGAEKRTVLFYESPRNVKDTAFLTFDYPEPDRDDDQWLYLPAMRKVRRISASDRGDYFLGTDFTYEDIKKESKSSLEDYRYETVGRETVDGAACWVVESVPVSAEVADELGYGRVRRWVDPSIWMARQAVFHDVNGNLLKTLRVLEIREVQGIWTAHRLEVENHKTGHRTVFTFRDVDYGAPVPDDVFTERALRRGAGAG